MRFVTEDMLLYKPGILYEKYLKNAASLTF
jgi:hypothetical protein